MVTHTLAFRVELARIVGLSQQLYREGKVNQGFQLLFEGFDMPQETALGLMKGTITVEEIDAHFEAKAAQARADEERVTRYQKDLMF